MSEHTPTPDRILQALARIEQRIIHHVEHQAAIIKDVYAANPEPEAENARLHNAATQRSRLASTPVVTEEAVEAGAIALWQEVDPAQGAWDDDAENFRREARAALTAALPHLTPDSPSAESEGETDDDWAMEHAEDILDANEAMEDNGPRVTGRVIAKARPADPEPSASEANERIEIAHIEDGRYAVSIEVPDGGWIRDLSKEDAERVASFLRTRPEPRAVSEEELRRAAVKWGVHPSGALGVVRALGITITPCTGERLMADEPNPVTREVDWTEDFEHENGYHQAKCVGCGSTFYGHKRRFICKRCAYAARASRESET